MGHLVIGRFAELEDALVERVLELKSGRPLAPVTIVVGSAAVRTRLGDLLVRRLGSAANIDIVSLGRLAAELATRELGAPPPVLAGMTRERFIRRLISSGSARGLAYFGPVSERPHFARALAATFMDLREAGVEPGSGWAFAAVEGAGGGTAGAGGTGAAKVADLEALYASYCHELQGRGLQDSAGIQVLATQRAATGPLAAAIVYGMYDLNATQEALVAALVAAGADLFVPQPRGCHGDDSPATRVGVAAGLGETRSTPPPPATDLDRLTPLWRGSPDPAGADKPRGASATGCAGAAATAGQLVLRGDGTLAVVSVADERDECREAVRAVLQAAAGGAAFWDCAVVAPHDDDIERLATALVDAGVPVACRLPDRSRAIRALQRLADCIAPPAGEPFSRRAVVEVLSAAPMRHSPPSPSTQALWLDEARRAGVVSGSEQWVERMRRRRHGLDQRIAELEARVSEAVETDDDDGHGAKVEQVRLRLQAASSLEAAVRALARACGGLPHLADWGAWADALASLAGQLFDVGSAAAIEDLAGRLRPLGILHEEVDVAEMAGVLRESLTEASQPEGRVGRDGVAVLTPLGLRGLRFHTVVFAGLAEGGFPARGRPDPILGDGERRRLMEACDVRLPLAEQRDAESTMLFALACEAARERLTLLVPRSDATSGRPRLPSRLVLRMASLAAGRPVGLDEFLSGDPLRPVWRRTAGMPLPEDADTVWLDARERDTAALLALSQRSRASARTYLAGVLEEQGAAERRLAQWRSGRSPEPGAWDGLLSGEARAALAGRHPFAAELHPTRLERYIGCPFAFLLRDVLELQAPEEPGESLEIEPLEYGNVAHDILQRAYTEVIARRLDRDAALAAVVPAWEAACAKAESRGVTGAAVSWEVRCAVLLEDMLECVRRDPVFARGEETPVMTEWRFGEGAERPVALELADGRRVRFAGRVDRVDAAGAGARVVDYKTGAGTTEEKRIKAGLSVQLPVYQLAVRQAGGASYDQITSLYRLVTRRGGFQDLPLPGDEDEALGRLRALVAAAMALADAGRFPRTSKSGCDYCDIAYACGLTAWARARKREHELLADVVDLQDNGPGEEAGDD